MNTIVWSTLITALATVAIAIFTYVNYQLASKIQKQDKEYRQQISDLYQAIVISNILSDPEARLGNIKLDNNIEAFKKLYKGDTPIFD
ncbi:MAG: hypothetical protein P8X47_09335 [Ignavibacteriaceae bacterium]|jgi:hypothetical protein